MGSSSLFERAGGYAMLDHAVDVLYQRVLADDRISGFFVGVDMARQRSMLTAYLAYALGGPIRFTGRHLTVAHARLVDMGLNDAHFDALAENFLATLTELNVPADVMRETLAVIANKRDDVLGRSGYSSSPMSPPEARKVG